MGQKTTMDSEHGIMLGFEDPMRIEPSRDRFPCCIVWTPLPFITWLVPFIGHVGICREDGVILDFAGPNFVCVDNFAFGAVSRYIQINKAKESSLSSNSCMFNEEGDATNEKEPTWDDALRKGTQEYQHYSYNILTCNCHSFVANNLNRLAIRSGGWNVVNLAALVFLKGRWVSKTAMVKAFLPTVVIYGIGMLIGGWTFVASCGVLAFLLTGWFILGTYCFKRLIQL
ncbi:unnamed protein product [Eruca vesicaria subsp. sativa]|uniref:Uncharacterized protein n=1 Tax=Eruca vesicaria subsp. sativa TaxID=29727 RepID=A0ABC8JFQ9_ERUVS|nr:unnamed protein product [Eruca vesicaria subsp. sativa]